MNLQGERVSPNSQERRRAQKYFMLLARDLSTREAYAILLRFLASLPHDGSRCSHIHGSNRNRIILHVMLKGRKTRARSSRQASISVLY